MHCRIFLTPVFLIASICVATGQPQRRTAMWSGTDDVFAYRDFAQKTVSIQGTPMVIDEDVEYFRSRPLNYQVKGESVTGGKVLGYDAAETLRFEGTYLRNALYGPSRTFHTNGATRDSGMLVMNLPHGEWNFYNADGQISSVRNYDAFMWWSLQWSIELQNPTWNWFELSDLYFKKRGSFLKAVDGRESFGNRYSPPFAWCLQHGKTTNYHDNGVVADSGYYYKGLPDGIFFYFHENGNLKEFGAWQMGKRIGTWKTLYPSGRLKQLRVYKYGQITESKSYEEVE